MKVEERLINIYTSFDGVEFLKEDACKAHEEKMHRFKFNYFVINCKPDLNETGLFMHKIYVAVHSSNLTKAMCEDIVMNYAIKTFGFLGPGVMGCGFMRTFDINNSNLEEFRSCKPTNWGGSSLESQRLLLYNNTYCDYNLEEYFEGLEFVKIDYKLF